MKKIISIALALLMVAVMLPVMAMAEDVYTALPAADSNGVITLDKNVTLSSYAKIDGKIKLDLNGHTITCTKNWAIVVMQYGTLTVVDSSAAGTGAIVCANGDESSRSAIYGGDNTAIIIEGGHLKGVDFGIVLMGKDSSLTVNGGVIEGEQGFGISGNGSMKNGVPECGPTTITINGGEIKGGEAGIYHPQKGTLNITGGTVSGTTGIYMKSGTANITGATISGTGPNAKPVANGNGADSTGDAIIMDSKTGYAGDMVLNLGAGNTITSTNGYALQVANTDVDTTNVVALNITGGNFTGNPDAVKLSKQFKDAVADANINASASITGGTFNGNTDELKPYIPSNMEITASGNVVNRPIIIYNPTVDTPKANDQKNPSTGANDFVGVAAAMAVVSLLGAAAVIRKK